METVMVVLVLALCASLFIRSRGAGASDDLAREVRELRARLETDSGHFSARLEGIDTRVARSQAAGQDLARDVFESLGDVKRATEMVAEQARSFGALQDILSAPKPRGGLGEAMLEELLRQVLPPSAYTMQHRFSDGRMVDAVVRAGGRLVCIDSKFPLDNYRRMCEASGDAELDRAQRAFGRDVERHIAHICDRYIAPDEGTLDLAVMYLPSEGVYAEVLRGEAGGRSLFDTAIAKRVVPMSPLTMYAYLQTLLLGLRYLKIERGADAVLRNCERLQRDLGRFTSEYETLGRHLGNARSKYEESLRSLEGLATRVDATVALTEPGGGSAPPLRPVEHPLGDREREKISGSG